MSKISNASSGSVSTLFSISEKDVPLFTRTSGSSIELETLESTTTNTSEKPTDWRSIYVIALLGFLSTVQVGGLINSIWPYLQLLDPSADETFLGYMNALRSGGSMITAPIAGFLSTKIAKIKLPLVFAHFLSFTVLVVYICVELLPSNRKYAFFVVELLFGMKIGLMGLARAHVAMVSLEQDRKKAVCIVTVAPLIGMTTGPLLQLAFTRMGYPGVNFLFGTHLNMYTLPAFIGIIGNLIGFVILLTLFEDPFKRLDISKSETPIITTKTAILVCFATKLVFSSITISKNSIQSPYMMTAFHWSNKEYITYHSIIAAVIGAIGVITHLAYIFIRKLSQRFEERNVIIFGLSTFFSFFVITYPWFFIHDKIIYEDTSTIGLNNTLVHAHAVGCPIEYDWCASTPAVNPFVYTISEVVLIGVSMPLLMINLDVIFSKLFTKRSQAAWQGLFVTAGDILNVGGPILATQVYAVSGPSYIWMFDMALMASLISVWITSYKFMKAPVNKV